ncbi:MAG: hypothetical protein ABI947_26360 [Chloroflexota bacterium]
MNFLKQLSNFLAPKAGPSRDPGLYYYVRCARCGEVIKVRINSMNDLSANDEGSLFVRKVIVGRRCYNRIEAEFTYDTNRKLIDTEINGGTLVTQTDYDTQQQTATQ